MFKKSIAALRKFQLCFKPSQSFEFFFYADSENAAANIAVSLHQLGYTVYEVGTPRFDSDKYSIIGNTPPLETEAKKMDAWCKQMTQHAEENDCFFDGWGSLIE